MRWWPSKRAAPTVEQRDLNPTVPPSWAEISGGGTYASTRVTLDTAIGLPAVGAAVRLLAETIAQLPLNVYKGRGADKRLADQTWQHRLLNEMPGMGDFTPFDLISDIVACLETNGNAYLQKVKAAGEVIALIVIDPNRVQVTRVNGEKVFRVHDREGKQRDYDAGTILHIRGFTTNGSDTGMSTISVYRQSLGTMQAQGEFQGRYYGQGTHVGGAIQVPGSLTNEQAEKYVRTVQARNSGLANSHLPLLLTNGAQWVQTSLNLEDSQFVESARMSLIDAAHVFRLPPKFLLGEGDLSEWDFIALGSAISPRLKRIELAFSMDADMFPQRVAYPEFDIRELFRTDAKTKAEVEHLQIQDGSRLVDEARADRGEPPLPPVPDDPSQTPGMVPQMTPVGGAPNPQPQNQPVQDAAATDGQ